MRMYISFRGLAETWFGVAFTFWTAVAVGVFYHHPVAQMVADRLNTVSESFQNGSFYAALILGIPAVSAVVPALVLMALDEKFPRSYG